MRKTTLYRVSVWNSRHLYWMETVVKSLADVVRLTVGLSTQWIVEEITPSRSLVILSDWRNTYRIQVRTRERYEHTLRSLASRSGLTANQYRICPLFVPVLA